MFDATGLNPDGSSGETCDPFGNAATPTIAVPGCNPNTCQSLVNWKCDDASLIGTAQYNCTCDNPAGTFATPDGTQCAQVKCAYPERCLANGLGCAPGAGGDNACDRCLTAADVAVLASSRSLNKAGYYKVGQSCVECPATSSAQIVAAAATVVVLAFFGFKASQLMGAQATSNIKKIIESLQFVSLSLTLSISWPGPVLRLGKFLEPLTFSIEFLRPECVATGLNWQNVFIASVFIVPVSTSLFIFISDVRAKRAYDRTVRRIHSERVGNSGATVYWIEAPGLLWGTRRTFVSEGGDKIVRELQRQYRFRASLRAFGVLTMTILYLPVVRMCLQSFECVQLDGVDGLRLEADIDINCESTTHKAYQVCAAFVLFVVGVGTPAYVVRLVRRIRFEGKLNDSRTLDVYGALYEVYRRDETSDERSLEIAQPHQMEWGDGESGERGEVDGTVHDGCATEAPWQTFDRALTIRRSPLERSPSAQARERAERMAWRDRLAVHFLAVELAQKSGVILTTSALVSNTSLSGWGLVLVNWFGAFVVYQCQPWRIMTLGFSRWRMRNALNRVEIAASFLQGVGPALIMIFPIERDDLGIPRRNLTFEVMTVIATGIITGLLSVRLLVFVGERLATKRQRMEIDGDPHECMERMRTSLVKFTKRGAIVSLYAFKADFDIKRRKTRARLEDTRDAMLRRIEMLKRDREEVLFSDIVDDANHDARVREVFSFDERITALYEVANKMAARVNAVTPSEPPEGSNSAERIRLAMEELSRLLSGEHDRRRAAQITSHEEDSLDRDAGLHLALQVHAHERILTRLEADMHEYAGAERMADLVELSEAYAYVKTSKGALSRSFGDAELSRATSSLNAQNVIQRLAVEDDFNVAFNTLASASAAVQRHLAWCDKQRTFAELVINQSAARRVAIKLDAREKSRTRGGRANMRERQHSLWTRKRSGSRATETPREHQARSLLALVPSEPALDADDVFIDVKKVLCQHESALALHTENLVRDLLPLFRCFGRLTHRRLNALAASLNLAPGTSHAQLTDYVERTLEWCERTCDALERWLLAFDATAPNRTLRGFRKLAVAAKQSLESVRRDVSKAFQRPLPRSTARANWRALWTSSASFTRMIARLNSLE